LLSYHFTGTSEYRFREELALPYAIVEVAGKQFRIEEEMSIQVPKLDYEEGHEIQFDNVLLYSDDKKVIAGKPHVKGVDVRAQVVGHVRGDKVTVFKMKRRKKYRRKSGTRAHYTTLKITKVAKV
jgi:large subunit ribosomal protein L21